MKNKAKNRLIDARKRMGYSQDYLSSVLEIDTSSYSRKENGQIKITSKEWQKLSETLEVPFEEIFELEENMVLIYNDSSSGNGNSNGYGNIVTNYALPQFVLDSLKNYIEKLEEENQNLKEKIRLLTNDNT